MPTRRRAPTHGRARCRGGFASTASGARLPKTNGCSRAQGKPLHEATVEAASVRLRPILMTSFAFILGVFPLVVARGAGGEMRRGLGTAVFSGMLGVTIFGLFLTPVFFAVLGRLSRRRRREPAAQPAPRPEPAEVT